MASLSFWSLSDSAMEFMPTSRPWSAYSKLARAEQRAGSYAGGAPYDEDVHEDDSEAMVPLVQQGRGLWHGSSLESAE